ncbi:uncharacterized protein [Amphiura filiformis]|uniref:uncharacterized protein n=1 Tax=Amphiura filiformis TaxID=82378 RepID=UPI003B211DDE
MLHSAVMQLCLQYHGAGNASMSIIDVGLQSGFTPIAMTLEKVTDDTPLIQFYEVTDRSVVFYADNIPGGDAVQPLCVTFEAQQDFEVGNVQPVPVKVYDYYLPTRKCIKFYRTDDNSPVLETLCDAQGEACQCVMESLPTQPDTETTTDTTAITAPITNNAIESLPTQPDTETTTTAITAPITNNAIVLSEPAVTELQASYTSPPEGCLPLMIIHSDKGSIVPAKNVYAYGDVITVYCREGFHRIGDEQLFCSNTGTWLGEIPKCSTDDQRDDSSMIIIAVGVGVAVGVVTIVIILVAIVVYCKRKRRPAYSNYIPPNGQDPTNLVEEQYDDTEIEIPLDDMIYDTIGDDGYMPLDEERKPEQGPYAYSTYIQPSVQDPTNPVEDQYDDTGIEIPLDKERKPAEGLSAYSTYVTPNEQDPTNPVDDQYDDTGVETQGQSAYSANVTPNEQDPTNPVEDQYDDTGVETQGQSAYSANVTPNEQDPTNPVEDQYDDTGIEIPVEIPLDTMGYATIGADRDIPNYQGLYADISN